MEHTVLVQGITADGRTLTATRTQVLIDGQAQRLLRPVAVFRDGGTHIWHTASGVLHLPRRSKGARIASWQGQPLR